MARVVLITDKKTTPTLFKSLSIEYLDRLVFGEVKSSSKDIVNELNVSSYPTLIAFAKDGTKEVYDGPIKQEKVIAFLDKFAEPLPEKPKSTKPKKDKGKKDKVYKDKKKQESPPKKEKETPKVPCMID